MVVDLNSCTGCSACMVACQAENNIPIVGKEQVINGREMHWIRTDRYFASIDENDPEPEMVSQPMMCQHCENAPCETVCPVNATVHSEDGLNVMAYNRCIGTRYCANNCPFKVRRFNFFDYNQRDVLGSKNGDWFTGLHEWNLISPKGTRGHDQDAEESERHRAHARRHGEMHLLRAAHPGSQDRRESGGPRFRRHPHSGGCLHLACAQACPADAIIFGDINNPESSVGKLKTSERGYRLLEYLNIQPRVTYLARIRNPNPKMPGAEKIGAAMKTHHGSEKHEAAETRRKPTRNVGSRRHSRNAAGTPAGSAGHQ